MNIRTKPELCDKEGCNKCPEFTISLSLAVHANHAPAQSSPILYMCKDHVFDYNFEDVVGKDGNWENICKTFRALGRAEPKKEFSSLLILPIKQ